MSSQLKKAKRMQLMAKILLVIGATCIFLSLVLLYLIFGHVVREEIRYDIRHLAQPKAPIVQITPVDTDFGIVIPKIGANAPVIPNVDPYNESAYQVALTKGVAHAKGSSFPEHANSGTVFLFAHSATNFTEANQYNAIFYLLNKLEKKDVITLYYKEKKYTYHVTDTKIVDEGEVQYMTKPSAKAQVILMTCWPAGTTLKRLLVIAQE